jgi:ABC-type uncharacterized transport system permease subunit
MKGLLFDEAEFKKKCRKVEYKWWKLSNTHLRLTAYHEAGHVIVARSLGVKITRIEVGLKRSLKGDCAGAYFHDEIDNAAVFAMMSLAGYIAEYMYMGQWRPAGSSRDGWAVSYGMKHMKGEKIKGTELHRIVAYSIEVYTILSQKWDEVESLAKDLLKNLPGKDFFGLIPK